MKTANLIEKERISALHFSKEDVLQDPGDRSRRAYDISRATILGNAFRNKASITFCTEQGEVKKVETTVWANDDNFVLLKAGTFLPLQSIIKVDNC